MALLLWSVAGFVGMEAFSWAFHKYVMHGPLWGIHKTHHEPHAGLFEANDIFSLLFGSVAAWAIYAGLSSGRDWMAGLGAGVTIYGLLYFILHDIAIHNRLKSRFWSRLPGIARIRRGHKIHHRYRERQPGRSFGLLFVHNSVFERGEES